MNRTTWLGLVLLVAFAPALNVCQAAGGPGSSTCVVKLNAPLAANADVGAVQISPDSNRVVYRAVYQTDQMTGEEVVELYSVPIGGGRAVKLNAPLVAKGSVLTFQISPDSSRVVYRADQETDEVPELYSVPIGGGNAVKLSPPLVAGGGVWDFQISGDSSQVVYGAIEDTSDVTNSTVCRLGVAVPSSSILP